MIWPCVVDEDSPIGLRNDDGSIMPLPHEKQDIELQIKASSGKEVEYAGSSEVIPECLGQLVSHIHLELLKAILTTDSGCWQNAT